MKTSDLLLLAGGALALYMFMPEKVKEATGGLTGGGGTAIDLSGLFSGFKMPDVNSGISGAGESVTDFWNSTTKDLETKFNQLGESNLGLINNGFNNILDKLGIGGNEKPEDGNKIKNIQLFPDFNIKFLPDVNLTGGHIKFPGINVEIPTPTYTYQGETYQPAKTSAWENALAGLPLVNLLFTTAKYGKPFAPLVKVPEGVPVGAQIPEKQLTFKEGATGAPESPALSQRDYKPNTIIAFTPGSPAYKKELVEKPSILWGAA